MLRYLRSLRQRLLTDNKFSKYLLYAIGEILLVVIGILIALQIDTWNEARKNRAEEYRILMQLRAEFLDNKEQIVSKIGLHEDIVRTSGVILDIIDKEDNRIPKDQLYAYLSKTLIAPTFDAANGVVRDLINSGKLYLIQNDSLRYQISGWEGNVQAATEEELVWRKVRDEQYGPFLKQLLSYRNISEAGTSDPQSSRKINFGSAYEQITIGKSKIASDSWTELSPNELAAFEDQLAGVISLNHVSKVQMMALQVIAQAILESLDREIAKRKS